jgi:hypothetical protein
VFIKDLNIPGISSVRKADPGDNEIMRNTQDAAFFNSKSGDGLQREGIYIKFRQFCRYSIQRMYPVNAL